MAEKIIDLSHPMYHEMPVWPDSTPVAIATEKHKEGWNVSIVCLSLHTATHLDAPSHNYPGAHTLDQISLDALVGDAAVVHVLGKPPKGKIGVEDIQKAENDIAETGRIILDTGWYKYYGRPGKPDFYTEFPELTQEAARWLVDKGIKFYATDAPTPSLSENVEVHQILFEKNIPVLENMTNLDQLTTSRVRLIALPINFKGIEGCPVRAVAIVP